MAEKAVKKPKEKRLKGTQEETRHAELRRPIVPEALDARLDGVSWSVYESDQLTGRTDLNRRSMTIPDEESPAGDSIRIHEMLHARMTPPNLMRVGNEKHGASIDSLQACEDMRINATARRHKLTEIYTTPVSDEQVGDIIFKLCEAAKAVERGPSIYNEQASRLYHRAACVAAALTDTTHADKAAALIQNNAPQDVFYQLHFARCEMLYSRWCLDGNKSPAATIRAALHLDRILQRHVGLVKGEARRPGGDPSNTEKVEPPPEIKGDNVQAMIDCLNVYEPELKQRARKKRPRAYKKTSDAGTLWRPTEAMRLDGTGLPFRRKLRQPHGCAILIDSSGSMGFGHEQLAEIVANIPGALVILHASNHDPHDPDWDGEKGTFAVVGKHDMVITERDLQQLRENDLGGGNANDAGACLLAGRLADRLKIRGPRFWVTDRGWGNLHGHIRTGNVTQVCLAAARKTKFQIVDSIEDIWASYPTLVYQGLGLDPHAARNRHAVSNTRAREQEKADLNELNITTLRFARMARQREREGQFDN